MSKIGGVVARNRPPFATPVRERQLCWPEPLSHPLELCEAMNMNYRLETFRRNVHSQNGEDGVIAEVARRMGLRIDENFWCVEFGAWDGVHLSNTFALVENQSARAIYIEGDQKKYRRLLETAGKFSTIIPVESLVVGSHIPQAPLVTKAFTGLFDSEKMATLDVILGKTQCPRDYDLLSIDIDSYDLDVWQAHEKFAPKIVVIEINSSVAPGILQWHGKGKQGNSFSSTMSVAKMKGYTLVCHTGNLIFVRDDLAHLLGLEEIDRVYPERLFDQGFLSVRQPDNLVTRGLRGIARRVFGQ